MARVLRYSDYGLYYASSYPCADGFINHVMAVPTPGSVATMDVDNALSLVALGTGGHYHLQVVSKDFMAMVTGPFDYRFTRPWSSSEVAYSMTRGLVLADLESGKVQTHTIIPGLTGHIGRIEPLRPERRTFVFQCEHLSGPGEPEWIRTLRVMRFAGAKAEIIGEVDAGWAREARAWFVHEGRLFVFDGGAHRLAVWNDELKPTSHELAETFDSVGGALATVLQVVPHSRRRLALIVAIVPDAFAETHPVGGLGVFVLRWGDGAPPTITPWFGSDFSPWGGYSPSLDYGDGNVLELSPDLRWAVVRVSSDHYSRNEQPGTPAFVPHPYRLAVPLDDGLDIDRPVKLLAPRGRLDSAASAAWSLQPLAYVTANQYHLLRWDFDALARAKWLRPQRG